MNKRLNQLLTFLAFFCLCQSAIAQDDSVYLDLGRVKLRKEFTQHITIKARDLEQMPFARLSDAIKPWLTGTFTNFENVVYVIDGNVANDADAWSIYDIDEITIVLNAETQISGSLKNQPLVLVKTKRKESPGKGLRVYGSSFLISRERPAGFSKDLDKHFFHQYHVTAWQHRKSVQYGLSANFLRDAYPQVDEFAPIHSPLQLKRYQINGWANVDLAEGHAVSLQLNYTPQSTTQNYSNGTSGGGDLDYKSRQTLLNPTLHLSNRIANGLTNELDASFVYGRIPTKTYSYTIFTDPNYRQDIDTRGNQDLNNLVIRERVSYNKSFGDWHLEPSLGFTFRSLRYEREFTQVVLRDGVLQQMSGSRFYQDGNLSVLTPAVAVGYKNSFYLHGGFAKNLSDNNPLYGDGIFPFASVSVDVLRLAAPENKYSLKIFGSYAKPLDFGDFQFTQRDLPGIPDYIPGVIFTGNPPLYIPFGGERKFNNIQAGLRFSLPGERVVLSYHFDDRDYLDEFTTYIPGGSGYDIVVSARNFSSSGHRLGVTAAIFEGPSRRWVTGLHAAATKISAEGTMLNNPYILGGNANRGETLVTGGWVNRVEIGNFYFGLDVHFIFNEQLPGVFLSEVESRNSYRINNVYAGYRLTVAKNKPLEIYISSRNALYDNKNAVDNRRYYGAGFQCQL